MWNVKLKNIYLNLCFLFTFMLCLCYVYVICQCCCESETTRWTPMKVFPFYAVRKIFSYKQNSQRSKMYSIQSVFIRSGLWLSSSKWEVIESVSRKFLRTLHERKFKWRLYFPFFLLPGAVENIFNEGWIVEHKGT